ncbi:MAG TPA: lipoyl domain-containing protein [Steroidobacteraceae bacterium]|jgi:pyruvate/2-oxoglutarate dehydrogenase complex dihydrolipoamide acyltransferase (E2) component
MEIIVPKLGFSMEEGTLAEWLLPDGSHVEKGAPLYTLESDKSAQEIESPGAGTLKILADAGGTYRVGTVIGLLT